MIPFPDKRYDIIYADPPWQDKGLLRNGVRTYQASDIYPTMSQQDICNLPVPTIVSDDCLLFLWTISGHLPESIEMGNLWGFEYKAIGFVWYKHAPIKACYTMSDCELCLIFKRGKIPQPRGKRNIRQFLSCKRGRHSEKPLEIKHRITEMFPTQSKIELFARPDTPLFPDTQWDYWGNEVDTQ